MRNTTTVEWPECCHISQPSEGDEKLAICHKPAKWQIVDGPTHDGYTFSCEEHLEDMKPDGEHYVYSVEEVLNLENFAREIKNVS